MHAPNARIIEQDPIATADASTDCAGPDGTGWFCMHRKVIKSAVFAVPELLKCLVWSLARANPTAAKVPVKTGRGTTLVELKAGEFITGRESAGEALGMPGTTAMDRLRRLEALGVIKLRSVTHFSIVSVVNWQAYQNASAKTRHPSVTQVTPNRHPSVTDNNQTIKQDSPSGESISPNAAEGFDQFWNAFPSGRKTAKGKARAAWAKAIKKAAPETIIAAAVEYAGSPVGSGKYVKGPEPWLNGECWADDRTAWNREDTTHDQRNGHAAGPGQRHDANAKLEGFT